LERPAVLIVDPDKERRAALSQGLAELGYEVIPAQGPDEGLKFAQGLGPSVIVAPADLMGFGDAGVLNRFQVRDETMKRTLLLLGEAGQDRDVPEDILYLPVDGLAAAEILRRIHLVLVGRELGVEADVELHSLVGDLSLQPLLEVVRSVNKALVTGHLELADGWIAFDRGAVIAARAGRARGTKAFCRLGRRQDGAFHVRIAAVDDMVEISEKVPDLVLRALEESMLEIPDRRARVRPVGIARMPDDASLTQGDILVQAIAQCETVGEMLDLLPATDGRILQVLNKLIREGMVRLDRPRPRVAVVTDSTCDLPPDLVEEHDVRVVPLSVMFGEDALRDGVDIQPRDFYHMLETEPVHPSTQPPSEAELFEQFRLLIDEQDVVAIHLSGKLSVTVDYARRAAQRVAEAFAALPEVRKDFALEVFDSRGVSMGIGLQALFAARMAVRGATAAAIVRRLETMAPRFHTLFVVDTLDYLLRGGRIGKARALVGKILGIKPILGVVEGEVASVDRVRGGRRAHPRIVQLFQERVERGRPVVVAVAHARAPVWADRLKTLLERSFEIRELILTDIGPVVGAHAGPGCVGAVLFQPTAEEWPLIGPLDR